MKPQNNASRRVYGRETIALNLCAHTVNTSLLMHRLVWQSLMTGLREVKRVGAPSQAARETVNLVLVACLKSNQNTHTFRRKCTWEPLNPCECTATLLSRDSVWHPLWCAVCIESSTECVCVCGTMFMHARAHICGVRCVTSLDPQLPAATFIPKLYLRYG